MAEAEGEGAIAPAESDEARTGALRIETAVPIAAARCAPEASITAPIAPAPAASQAAAAARPAPRPPARSWIATLVLAGVIGGGIAAAIFGIVWMLDAARIFRTLSNDSVVSVFAFDAVVGVLITLRVGFRERARRLGELATRAVGVLVFGAMTWGAVLALVFSLREVGPNDELHSAAEFCAFGLIVALAGFVLERRKPKPRRLDEHAITLPEDRRNAPLAWSGVLGGSLAVWAVGSLAAYDKTISHIHDGPLVLMMAAGVVAVAVLATSRGYASNVRPRIGLGRRLGGTIGFGFLAALALALFFGVFQSAASPHVSTMRAALVILPALIACAALAGVHVLTPALRASLREAIITGTAILFATLYVESTWVRYAFGSETAALSLATDHYEDGDYEISARYFEIACKRGDDLACVRASAQYDAGLGVHVDAKHADALLRLACDEPDACLALASSAGDARTKERAAKRACDLAGGKYCDRYRVAVLAGACEERDVFACRDLARLSEGSGMAQYYYQKACAFGDVEACAKAR